MKYRSLLLLLALCRFQPLAAQSPDPVFLRYTANQVEAGLRSDGSLFYDGQSGAFVPQAPNLPAIALVHYAGLWLAGHDGAGNLRASRHRQGPSDFRPGQYGQDPSTSIPHNKVWQVTCADIAQHRADFADNGFIDNPNPHVFGYPGKDNPHFQQYNPDQPPLQPGKAYADFLDHDDDGRYDPAAGDYPNIRWRNSNVAVLPELITWTMSQDGVEGLDAPMQADVQTTSFVYHLNEGWAIPRAINNTVYVRYKITYRGNEPLTDVYSGIFSAFNIGAPGDDYMGTSPERGIFYAYDPDAVQEADLGYDGELPIAAVSMLLGPLNAIGVPISLSAMRKIDDALPSAQAAHRLMAGLNPDGSVPVNGKFDYRGNPYLPGSDAETTAGNPPGPRTVMGAWGPQQLNPGDEWETVVAFYYTHDTLSAAGIYQQMLTNEAFIQGVAFDNFSGFESGCDQTVQASEPLAGPNALRLFPNPARVHCTVEGKLENFENILIFNALGQLVHEVRLDAPAAAHRFETANWPPGLYFVRAGGATALLVVGG